ncbi:TPA: hypothetical protein N0F65_005364 [Lagenidium giganteum]|uniref:ADP-ribosylation factor-like protein 16 n=1 Tax=Lagenidium giganteum TaxID=4803 RepID=A0AAV2YL98_9STRA|nr:TPA: hypothetical protein N0F65_005356 [Lagenidium giganteum]DAZ94601.1 TPA: hypothetical protein N0F65_005364 [Lagenidium giganteum]
MKNGLLLGLDGVGKTLLLRQLAAQLTRSQRGVIERIRAIAHHVSTTASTAAGAAVAVARSRGSAAVGPSPTAFLIHRETQPTIGVEHTTLTIDTRNCSICEVGGQLLPMWKAYYAACDFWIYVIDIANPAQVCGAAIELFAILQHETMRSKPKLVLLNKTDAYFTLDDQLLRSYLCLDQLYADPTAQDHNLTVVKVSALTGENMDMVIKWLAQRMSSSHPHNHGHGQHHLHHHHHASSHASVSTPPADTGPTEPRVHPVARA